MTKIGGFILRCKDRKITAKFYSKLGLTTNEHQHGGPLHFEVEPIVDELVVELYAASEKFPRDAIILMVDSINKALKAVKDLGIKPKTAKIKSQNLFFSFIYITDPDGRDVMLIEKAKRTLKLNRK